MPQNKTKAPWVMIIISIVAATLFTVLVPPIARAQENHRIETRASVATEANNRQADLL